MVHLDGAGRSHPLNKSSPNRPPLWERQTKFSKTIKRSKHFLPQLKYPDYTYKTLTDMIIFFLEYMCFFENVALSLLSFSLSNFYSFGSSMHLQITSIMFKGQRSKSLLKIFCHWQKYVNPHRIIAIYQNCKEVASNSSLFTVPCSFCKSEQYFFSEIDLLPDDFYI